MEGSERREESNLSPSSSIERDSTKLGRMNRARNYRLVLPPPSPLSSKQSFRRATRYDVPFQRISVSSALAFARDKFILSNFAIPTHPPPPSSTTVISRRNITLSRARIPAYQIFCTLLFQRGGIRTLWINNRPGRGSLRKVILSRMINCAGRNSVFFSFFFFF